MFDIKDLLKLTPRTMIEKGWGIPAGDEKVGEVFVYHTDQEDDRTLMKVETVKVLYIDTNKTLSYHFHINKQEIFYMALGSVELSFGTDTMGNDKQTVILKEGQSVIIPPKLIHSMKGISEGINILIEVSTLDKPEDSIRLVKGD